MSTLRPCGRDDHATIFTIVNAAAEAYRGVIPSDCWHEPYMSRDELDGEIAAGVEFWGIESDGELIGVMGIQQVRDVDLIRHAYVLPSAQGRGVGTDLLLHLQEARSRRPMLIGTWTAAEWAIWFYQRHGFALVPESEKASLLKSTGPSPTGESRRRSCWQSRPMTSDLGRLFRAIVAAAVCA